MKRFVSPYFRFRLLVSGANSRRFFSRVFRSHLLVIGALRDDSVREKWDRREENRQSLFSPNGMTVLLPSRHLGNLLARIPVFPPQKELDRIRLLFCNPYRNVCLLS